MRKEQRWRRDGFAAVIDTDYSFLREQVYEKFKNKAQPAASIRRTRDSDVPPENVGAVLRSILAGAYNPFSKKFEYVEYAKENLTMYPLNANVLGRKVRNPHHKNQQGLEMWSRELTISRPNEDLTSDEDELERAMRSIR